jgi:hypothetical protein
LEDRGPELYRDKSTLMPYRYLEHPDSRIKWNLWSQDEGMANRRHGEALGGARTGCSMPE